MRVLLVADVDPVAVIGGGERLLAAHAAGLAARGHEVVVCSGAPGAPGERGGVRVLRIGRSPATPPRAAAAVRALRPDVVLGYQPACALGALRAARRRGIPSVYVLLSCWAREYATRRRRPRRLGIALRRAAERACLRASDRVVVLSAYMAAQVRAEHPVVAADVRLVPGGVDGAFFSPNGTRDAARARLGLPPAGRILVTVRNLVPRTGVAALLEAMPEVLRAAPDARLVVVGDGPLRPALEARASALGLDDRVSFAGYCPDERLPDHYRAADLAVLPTVDLEGFGLATVEALACGTPVLGTPVGATPEILAPLDPALVARDATPEALAAGIVALLRRPSGDLPERARQHALRLYSWDAAVARLASVIGEVAS